MSAVIIRNAHATDAGKAGAILSEFVDETPWMPRIHTRAEDIGFVGTMIDRGWVNIAEIDQRVVGFLARDGHEVHALYITQNAWRQGCGKALLQEAQGATSKLSLWTFQANEAAYAFYAAQGFNEVERTDGANNDEHLPDIRFEWHKEII